MLAHLPAVDPLGRCSGPYACLNHMHTSYENINYVISNLRQIHVNANVDVKVKVEIAMSESDLDDCGEAAPHPKGGTTWIIYIYIYIYLDMCETYASKLKLVHVS